MKILTTKDCLSIGMVNKKLKNLIKRKRFSMQSNISKYSYLIGPVGSIEMTWNSRSILFICMITYDIYNLLSIIIDIDVFIRVLHHITKRVATSTHTPVDKIRCDKISHSATRFDFEGFSFLTFNFRTEWHLLKFKIWKSEKEKWMS